jgi:flagellar biosynthesis protein FlhB
VASAIPLPRRAAALAAAGAAVEAAASDVIQNPGHFSIAFVFAYNRE